METISRFLLDLYRASREAPFESFQPSVYKMLAPVLKVDSAMWGSGSMSTGELVVHNIDLYRQSMDLIENWAHIAHEDRLIPAIAANPGKCISMQMAATYDAASAIRDHGNKFEIQNVAAIGTVDPTSRTAHWLSLYRADKKTVFTESEQLLFQIIYPHLIEALAINRAIHLDRTYGAGTSARPCGAVADLKGLIYFAEPSFLALVEMEWPGAGKSALPESLVRTLETDGRHAGRSIVLYSARAKDLLFLRARARRPVDGLTGRQKAIAEQYARGLSHKEIARALDLAPSTIRNQLASVYAKLAVDDKAQLASLLVDSN